MTHSPTILAIDTSSMACSVALLREGKVDEEILHQAKHRAQFILEMLDMLLKRNNLNIAAIDVLAYAEGPGSFTGLRVGASVVQGLSFAHDKPVVGVSTLQMMAQGAYRLYHDSKVLVALDARMQEVYWGIYTLNTEKNLMEAVMPDSVSAPDKVILPKQSGWLGVGNGWVEYKEPLRLRCKGILDKIQTDFLPLASDLLESASQAYFQGKVKKSHQVVPVYIRDV